MHLTKRLRLDLKLPFTGDLSPAVIGTAIAARISTAPELDAEPIVVVAIRALFRGEATKLSDEELDAILAGWREARGFSLFARTATEIAAVTPAPRAQLSLF